MLQVGCEIFCVRRLRVFSYHSHVNLFHLCVYCVGFSEDDLEKPKFQKAATLAKVPFVLSAPDAPHAVSVCAVLQMDSM